MGIHNSLYVIERKSHVYSQSLISSLKRDISLWDLSDTLVVDCGTLLVSACGGEYSL